MILKNSKLFKLPQFRGGYFNGMDRLLISHNILILKKVAQRDDNGDIHLSTKAVNGPEELSGEIKFVIDDRHKKDILYKWLREQIGRDIEAIYNAEFIFGDETL